MTVSEHTSTPKRERENDGRNEWFTFVCVRCVSIIIVYTRWLARSESLFPSLFFFPFSSYIWQRLVAVVVFLNIHVSLLQSSLRDSIRQIINVRERLLFASFNSIELERMVTLIKLLMPLKENRVWAKTNTCLLLSCMNLHRKKSVVWHEYKINWCINFNSCISPLRSTLF